MRKTLESTNAVHISNPKALEFQVSLHCSLLFCRGSEVFQNYVHFVFNKIIIFRMSGRSLGQVYYLEY